MPSSITFILPSLFEPHCLSFLDDGNQRLMDQLNASIKLARQSPLQDHDDWLIEHLDISAKHKNSAQLMIVGEGNSDNDSSYWLRADPVMLTASHNGILCRGNRVLNITDEERLSLELLLNDYLRDQPMELVLSNVQQGYLKIDQPVDCKFVPLAEVLGQDISHRLPKEKQWHCLLTDFQMLLHNCDVNQRRAEQGQPIINGFWFWGEDRYIANEKNKVSGADLFYTDELSLSGALAKQTNLSKLKDSFNPKDFSEQHNICIHVSELEERFIQNDMEGWLDLYQYWVKAWLLPCINSVNNHELTSITLIPGNGTQYQYTGYSKWCFWRKLRSKT